MASRFSVYFFSALLVVCGLLALKSIPSLPENAAIILMRRMRRTRGFPRGQYRVFILLFLVGVPLLLVWVMAWLPRLTGGKGQIPDCEYWFADERRGETEHFLLSHALWLGSLTVAVVYGTHLTIQRANSLAPAILADKTLTWMLVIYLCGLVWWFTRFMRHFQIPTNQSGLIASFGHGGISV